MNAKLHQAADSGGKQRVVASMPLQAEVQSRERECGRWMRRGGAVMLRIAAAAADIARGGAAWELQRGLG